MSFLYRSSWNLPMSWTNFHQNAVSPRSYRSSAQLLRVLTAFIHLTDFCIFCNFSLGFFVPCLYTYLREWSNEQNWWCDSEVVCKVNNCKIETSFYFHLPTFRNSSLRSFYSCRVSCLFFWIRWNIHIGQYNRRFLFFLPPSLSRTFCYLCLYSLLNLTFRTHKRVLKLVLNSIFIKVWRSSSRQLLLLFNAIESMDVEILSTSLVDAGSFEFFLVVRLPDLTWHLWIKLYICLIM